MFFWTCLKETKAQTSWTDKSGRGRACLGPSLPSSVLPPAPWLAAAVIRRLWELTNSLFVLSDVLEFHFWTLPVLWQNVANVLVLTTEELRVLTSGVSVCLNNRYCFCHQCAQKAWWCRCWAVFSPPPSLGPVYMLLLQWGAGPEWAPQRQARPHSSQLPYLVWAAHVSLVVGFCASADCGNWESWHFLAWRGIFTLSQTREESLVSLRLFLA